MVLGETMAYSSKFVLAILVDGVPQKELANGEVHLEFGTHYAIRLRNRNPRNAAAKIFIDGENVSGEGFKVPANDKVDIKRWADKDVTFRFVDLDSPAAVEYGKNGPNHDKVKGVVEVRFTLEKAKPEPTRVEHVHHYHQYPYYHPYRDRYRWNTGIKLSDSFDAVKTNTCSSNGAFADMAKGGTVRDSAASNWSCASPPSSLGFCDSDVEQDHSPSSGAQGLPDVLREGATVEGHASHQTFNKVHMELEEGYVSVKVFLKGYNPKPKAQVVETVSVVKSQFCTSCGTQNRTEDRFCGHCGVKTG